MTTRGRLVVAGLLALTSGTLAACANPADPAATPTPNAPASTPGPTESDLPPGWDEPGDGPTPTPADELTAEQLSSILRLPATAPVSAATCTDVDVHLTFVDAATGHRYGILSVENVGDARCEVRGYPGLGVRGSWGSTFVLALEQRDPIDGGTQQGVVPLDPGARAVANVEWTGALAGAESEHAELLVVQLAAGATPVTVPVSYDGGHGTRDVGIDIGMETTVRVGPLAPATSLS